MVKQITVQLVQNNSCSQGQMIWNIQHLPHQSPETQEI